MTMIADARELQVGVTLITKMSPPRHQPGEKFLKGPIPWTWLQMAGKLRGRALQVGVLLWQKVGCERKSTIEFCLARGREMGMSVPVTRRGLRELEDAGLVTVARRPGRGLLVSIEMPDERTGPTDAESRES